MPTNDNEILTLGLDINDSPLNQKVEAIEEKITSLKEKASSILTDSESVNLPGYSESMQTRYSAWESSLEDILRARKAIDQAGNSVERADLSANFQRKVEIAEKSIQDMYKSVTIAKDFQKDITPVFIQGIQGVMGQLNTAFKSVAIEIAQAPKNKLADLSDKKFIDEFMKSDPYRSIMGPLQQASPKVFTEKAMSAYLQSQMPFAVPQYIRNDVVGNSAVTFRKKPESFREMVPASYSNISVDRPTTLRKLGSSEGGNLPLTQVEQEKLDKIVRRDRAAEDAAVAAGVYGRSERRLYYNPKATRDMVNAMGGYAFQDVVVGARGESKYGIDDVEDPDKWDHIAKKQGKNRKMDGGLSTVRALSDEFSWHKPGYYEEAPVFNPSDAATPKRYVGQLNHSPSEVHRAFAEYTSEMMDAGVRINGRNPVKKVGGVWTAYPDITGPRAAKGNRPAITVDDFHTIGLNGSMLMDIVESMPHARKTGHNEFSDNMIYLKHDERLADQYMPEEEREKILSQIATKFEKGFDVGEGPNKKHYIRTRLSKTHTEFMWDKIVDDIGRYALGMDPDASPDAPTSDAIRNAGLEILANGAGLEGFDDPKAFAKAMYNMNLLATDGENIQSLWGTNFGFEGNAETEKRLSAPNMSDAQKRHVMETYGTPTKKVVVARFTKKDKNGEDVLKYSDGANWAFDPSIQQSFQGRSFGGKATYVKANLAGMKAENPDQIRENAITAQKIAEAGPNITDEQRQSILTQYGDFLIPGAGIDGGDLLIPWDTDYVEDVSNIKNKAIFKDEKGKALSQEQLNARRSRDYSRFGVYAKTTYDDAGTSSRWMSKQLTNSAMAAAFQDEEVNEFFSGVLFDEIKRLNQDEQYVRDVLFGGDQSVDLTTSTSRKVINDHINNMLERYSEGDRLLPTGVASYSMAAPNPQNIINYMLQNAGKKLTQRQKDLHLGANQVVSAKSKAKRVSLFRFPATVSGNIIADNAWNGNAPTSGTQSSGALIRSHFERMGLDKKGLYFDPASHVLVDSQGEDFDGDKNMQMDILSSMFDLSGMPEDKKDEFLRIATKMVNLSQNEHIFLGAKANMEKKDAADGKESSFKNSSSRKDDIDKVKEIQAVRKGNLTIKPQPEKGRTYSIFNARDAAEWIPKVLQTSPMMGGADRATDLMALLYNNAGEIDPEIAQAILDHESQYDVVSTYLKNAEKWNRTGEQKKAGELGRAFTRIFEWAAKDVTTTGENAESYKVWDQKAQEAFNKRGFDKINLPSSASGALIGTLRTRIKAKQQGLSINGEGQYGEDLYNWDTILDPKNMALSEDANSEAGKLTLMLRNVKKGFLNGDFLALSKEDEAMIAAQKQRARDEISKDIQAQVAAGKIKEEDAQKEYYRRYEEAGGYVADNIANYAYSETAIEQNEERKAQIERFAQSMGMTVDQLYSRYHANQQAAAQPQPAPKPEKPKSQETKKPAQTKPKKAKEQKPAEAQSEQAAAEVPQPESQQPPVEETAKDAITEAVAKKDAEEATEKTAVQEAATKAEAVSEAEEEAKQELQSEEQKPKLEIKKPKAEVTVGTTVPGLPEKPQESVPDVQKSAADEARELLHQKVNGRRISDSQIEAILSLPRETVASAVESGDWKGLITKGVGQQTAQKALELLRGSRYADFNPESEPVLGWQVEPKTEEQKEQEAHVATETVPADVLEPPKPPVKPHNQPPAEKGSSSGEPPVNPPEQPADQEHWYIRNLRHRVGLNENILATTQSTDEAYKKKLQAELEEDKKKLAEAAASGNSYAWAEDQVREIESRYGSVPSVIPSTSEEPPRQKTCPVCGTKYDASLKECPNKANHKTDNNKPTPPVETQAAASETGSSSAEVGAANEPSKDSVDGNINQFFSQIAQARYAELKQQSSDFAKQLYIKDKQTQAQLNETPQSIQRLDVNNAIAGKYIRQINEFRNTDEFKSLSAEQQNDLVRLTTGKTSLYTSVGNDFKDTSLLNSKNLIEDLSTANDKIAGTYDPQIEALEKWRKKIDEVAAAQKRLKEMSSDKTYAEETRKEYAEAAEQLGKDLERLIDEEHQLDAFTQDRQTLKQQQRNFQTNQLITQGKQLDRSRFGQDHGIIGRIMQTRESSLKSWQDYKSQIDNQYFEEQNRFNRMKPEDEGYQAAADRLKELKQASEHAGKQVTSLAGGFGFAEAAAAQFSTVLSNLSKRLGRQLFNKALQETKRFVKEYNAAMTNIQMITLKSDSEMSTLGDGLIAKAQELKISISEVTQMATELYRQGLTDDEMDERLDVIAKFSKVSGTKAGDATKLITTAMNTGLVDNAQYAADVVAKIGDSAATNAAQIEKGIEKAGAAAATDGTTYAQLVAMLTAITATTQVTGNVAGTTLNSIFGRMNKVGTNELIYDENGNTMSGSAIATLLRAQGIATNNKDGTRRSSYDMLYDLSQKYDSMTEDQQRQIATAISGTRQFSNFGAIMAGMREGDVERYLSLAESANGTVDQKYGIYEKSMQASMDNLRNTWDALIAHLTESGAITGFVDNLTKLIEGFDNLTGSLGNLEGSLPILITLLGIIQGFKIGSVFGGFGAGIGALVGGIGAFAGYNILNGAANQSTADSRLSQARTVYKDIAVSRTEGLDRFNSLAENENRTEEENTEYFNLSKTLAVKFGLVDSSAASTISSMEELSKAIKDAGDTSTDTADAINNAAKEEAERAWAQNVNENRADVASALAADMKSIDSEREDLSNSFIKRLGIATYNSETGQYEITKNASQNQRTNIATATMNSDLGGLPGWVNRLFGIDLLDWNQDFSTILPQLYASAAMAGRIRNEDGSLLGNKEKSVDYWTKRLKEGKVTENEIQGLVDYYNYMNEQNRGDPNAGTTAKVKEKLKSRLVNDLRLNEHMSDEEVDALAQIGAEYHMSSNNPERSTVADMEYLLGNGLTFDEQIGQARERLIQHGVSKKSDADAAAEIGLDYLGAGTYYIGSDGKHYSFEEASKIQGQYEERLKEEQAKLEATPVFWYADVDTGKTVNSKNGQRFETAEARDAAQKEYESQLKLWQSKYYDYNKHEWITSDLLNEEDANKVLTEQYEQAKNTAFRLRNPLTGYIPDVAFGSEEEAQKYADESNRKEEERFERDMQRAIRRQQEKSIASYTNLNGETVSRVGTTAHRDIDALRQAEIDETPYVIVLQGTNQVVEKFRSEEDAYKALNQNYTLFTDEEGHYEYGMGDEARRKLNERRKEITENPDNYEYYVNGLYFGTGEEAKKAAYASEGTYRLKDGSYHAKTKEDMIHELGYDTLANDYRTAHPELTEEQALHWVMEESSGIAHFSDRVERIAPEVTEEFVGGDFEKLELVPMMTNYAVKSAEEIVSGITDIVPELDKIKPAQVLKVWGKLPSEIKTVLTKAVETGETTVDQATAAKEAIEKVQKELTFTAYRDRVTPLVEQGALTWEESNKQKLFADQAVAMFREGNYSSYEDFLLNTGDEGQAIIANLLTSDVKNGELAEILNGVVVRNGEIVSEDNTVWDSLLNWVYGKSSSGKQYLNTSEKAGRASNLFNVITHGKTYGPDQNVFFNSSQMQQAYNDFIDSKNLKETYENYKTRVVGEANALSYEDWIDKYYGSYKDFASNKSLISKEDQDYLKEIIGEEAFTKLTTEGASEEEETYYGQLLANRQYGLTGLTTEQKLAGIQDVRDAIEGGSFSKYSEIAANAYLSGFSGWEELSALVREKESGLETFTEEDQKQLDKLMAELDSYQNSESLKSSYSRNIRNNASEIANNIDVLRNGTAYEREAVYSGYYSDISKLSMAQSALNGDLTNESNQEYIATLLGVDPEYVKATLGQEGGKGKLESQVKQKVADVTEKIQTELLGSLGIEFDATDIESLQTQIDSKITELSDSTEEIDQAVIDKLQEASDALKAGTATLSPGDAIDTYGTWKKETNNTAAINGMVGVLTEGMSYNQAIEALVGKDKTFKSNADFESFLKENTAITNVLQRLKEGGTMTPELMNMFTQASTAALLSPDENNRLQASKFYGLTNEQGGIDVTALQNLVNEDDVFRTWIEQFEELNDLSLDVNGTLDGTGDSIKSLKSSINSLIIKALRPWGDQTEEILERQKSVNRTLKDQNAANKNWRSTLKNFNNDQYSREALRKGKGIDDEAKNYLEGLGFDKNDYKNKDMWDEIAAAIDEDEAAGLEELTEAYQSAFGDISDQLSDYAHNNPIMVDGVNVSVGEGTVSLEGQALLDQFGDFLSEQQKQMIQDAINSGLQVIYDMYNDGQGNISVVPRVTGIRGSSSVGGAGRRDSSKKGGGGGKSKLDALIEGQGHYVKRYEHDINMAETYSTYLQRANDYQGSLDAIDAQIIAQQRLKNQLEANVVELEKMQATLNRGSEDWYKAQEQIDSYRESIAGTNNAIKDLNGSKIQITETKQSNEDKPTTHASSMLSLKAQNYMDRGQFENYAVVKKNEINNMRIDMAINEQQKSEWEDQLKIYEEGSQDWIDVRDRIWSIIEENAQLENQILEETNALNEARISQVATDLQNSLAPYEHEQNMLGTYGSIYQNDQRFVDYRESLAQTNGYNETQAAYYQNAIAELQKQMKGLDVGSEAWLSGRDAIYQYQEALASTTLTIQENTAAIEESYVTELTDKYQTSKGDLDHEARMAQLTADYYERDKDYVNYQNMLGVQAEITGRSIANTEKNLAAFEAKLNDGTIRAGSEAWKNLKSQILSAREELLEGKNTMADLERQMQQSEIEHYAEQFNKAYEEVQHNIKMIEKEIQRYQTNGEFTNQNIMIGFNNKELEEGRSLIEGYIEVIKKSLNDPNLNDDSRKGLINDLYKWEEALEDVNNSIDKNNDLVKKNNEAIVKTKNAVEEAVLAEIKDRIQAERDMLDGRTAMENNMIQIIRKRYQDEWALVQKDINKKKEALSKEKSLISERLNAKKEAVDAEDRYERLAELQRQYALISSDVTRSKDALALKKQIDDLSKENAMYQADKAAQAQTEALDEQIKAYDDDLSTRSEQLNEYLENANNFKDELNLILTGSYEDYVEWMKVNNEDYKNSTDATRQVMENSWEDTWKKMKDIVDTYWTEIATIISSQESFISFMNEGRKRRHAETSTGAELQDISNERIYEEWQNAIRATATWDHDHEFIEQVEKLKEYTYTVEPTPDFISEIGKYFSDPEYVFERDKSVSADARTYTGYDQYSEIIGAVEGLDSMVADIRHNVELIATQSPTVEIYVGGSSSSSSSGSGSGGTGGKKTDSKNTETTDHGYSFTSISASGRSSSRSDHGYSSKEAAQKAAEKEINANMRSELNKLTGTPGTTVYDYAYNQIVERHRQMKNSIKAYASGGMVDYTGPAWVDGTKTRPEAFLDAIDTENIRRLTEALNYVSVAPMMTPSSDLMQGNTQNIGDINITINEAKINNDYDVAKLADQVSSQFTKALSKRGLNLTQYAF